MQRVPLRTMRVTNELHARFVKQLVPLLHVAWQAGADNVVPARLSAARNRDDVIEGKLGRGELPPTVLAAVLIAEIDVSAGELHFLPRHPVESEKLNDVRDQDV